MMIVQRDIELMGWILEQKFMSVVQVKKVFWKGVSDKTTEACRRLCVLEREGYLKRNTNGFYRQVLYVVTKQGVKLLRGFGRDRGLSAVEDVDHSNYKHDLAVTDVRILFHDLGYTEWLSERLLIQWPELRRLPDGTIHHQGRYFAVEYESAQKSRDRYRKMFLDYELDPLIHEVIYVVDPPALLTKISREAANYAKLHFTTVQDLERQKLDTTLKGTDSKATLGKLLTVPA